tara:strand:+ start:340 stop:690 length:351 start_codon:yes stop_codon:yes gene_type:complete
MPKFVSIVKFKVKSGEEQNFIESMKNFKLPDGLIYRKLIKTGDNSFCSIIEWANEKSLANARSQMITFLDTIRDILLEFSQDLGVTDPASGPLVIDQVGLIAQPGKTLSGRISIKN